MEENDLRLLLIRRVTVKWETAKPGIFRMKMTSKREENMLRQPCILQIYHLESIVSVLNLVTLSL
jgi:hypothetical protein